MARSAADIAHRDEATATRLTMIGRLQIVCTHALLHAAARYRPVAGTDGVRRNTVAGRHDKASASAAADLTALAAGIARFVGCPLVGRPFFVGGAAAFACDLALFFRRHRRESPTFFTFVTHRF